MAAPLKPTTKRIVLIALLSLTGLATIVVILAMLLSGLHGAEFASMAGAGIALLVLVSFAAYTALDKPWWRLLAGAGMCLSAVMFIVHPLFAWVSSQRYYAYSSRGAAPEYEWYDTIAHLNATGLATAALLCLLAYVMVPKIKLLGLLLQIGTALCMITLYCNVMLLTWGFIDGGPEFFGQFFMALIVLCLAGLFAIAILNKFFGIKVAKPVSYSNATIHLDCPRCRQTIDILEGDSACPVCKLKIKIELEEPLCPKCNYNLHNLTTPRCPECGTYLPGVQAAPMATAGFPVEVTHSEEKEP